MVPERIMIGRPDFLTIPCILIYRHYVLVSDQGQQRWCIEACTISPDISPRSYVKSFSFHLN